MPVPWYVLENALSTTKPVVKTGYGSCFILVVRLVPDTADSGETKRTKGITHRHNPYLRTALVESSWSVVRKDPALLMKYKQYCFRLVRQYKISEQLNNKIKSFYKHPIV